MAKEEETVFGLTINEVGKIADSIYDRIDQNHPVSDGSFDSYIQFMNERINSSLEDKKNNPL